MTKIKTLIKRITAAALCLILGAQLLCTPVFADSPYPGDQMIYLTQRWLNQQYGDVEGFGSVPENGKTGWDTVYGLLRALQHELGITELANSFGPKTTALYSQNLLTRQDGVTDNKFAILQGALWCKGYSPGYNVYEAADGAVVFDAVFDSAVEQAVISLKTDAGLLQPDGTVTVDVMKALMSMDTFSLTSTGSIYIRQLQQSLNRDFGDYIGIIPCDGVYGRNTNKALIYALQATEGLPTDVANGNFGVTTRRCCPTLPYTADIAATSYDGRRYTDSETTAFTRLLQYALLANGHGDGAVNGVFDDKTQQYIRDFQAKMALPVTGVADLSTWMSLLVSCGDTSRPAVAADCATILTPQTAKALYDNGYRYIGRYLTIAGKAITKQEAQIIFDAGLRFFPIYQTTGNYAEYFTLAQGVTDAGKALEAARALGLPQNTVIYFAVDFDCMDYQITSGVIPYFKSINAQLDGSGYKVGIYGTRNACIRVSSQGLAQYSFVSDMSTGYSGNLGFSMPDNWAFDQFATVTVGGIEIDKNGWSGRDSGVGELVEQPPELLDASLIFTDVKAKAWYKRFIDYAVTHGIFDGTTKTTFSPNGNITRAQFVQVLANISNVDTSNRNVKTVFTDVPSGKWYTYAVKWAYDNKIVSGISPSTFAPDENITREQMCVMLVAYAKFRGLTLNVLEPKAGFTDDGSISRWARDEVYICQQADIVNGKGGGAFDPKATGTRAEAATIFTKFHTDYIAK